PYARSLGELLQGWALRAPARTFLAERRRDGAWRRVTYAEALQAARAIGQALLERGLGPERPVMILSDNSIDHALLMLGAMQAGLRAAPISTAYSLMSQDFAKLRRIHEVLTPGLIFAEDGARYAGALRLLAGSGDAAIAVSANPPNGLRARGSAELLATQPG